MTVATDDFNRANGSLGANYTNFIGGGLSVASNRAIGTTNEERSSLRTAESFADDQYAKFTVTFADQAKYVGVVLRGSGADGTRNCYLVDYGGGANDWFIARYVNGSGTNLVVGDFGIGGIQAGDVFEGRVEGNVVSLWLNGVMVDSVVDSTHASGAPGLYTYTTGELDNAEFGDIGGASFQAAWARNINTVIG